MNRLLLIALPTLLAACTQAGNGTARDDTGRASASGHGCRHGCVPAVAPVAATPPVASQSSRKWR